MTDVPTFAPAQRPLRVAVGSRNPVKIAAATAIVRHAWPDAIVESVAVASGVPDQPWGDDETQRGAIARSVAARAALDADLGIGIEGGVVDENGALRTCAWAAVSMADGSVHLGGSLAMPLPPAVAHLVRDGVELGDAMDTVSRSINTKHGAGACGILTAGIVDRQRAYEVLVAYACAPLLAPEFWVPAQADAGI